MNYQDYITLDPNKRGGKPCVRNLRITVYEILEYLASDMTEEEIPPKVIWVKLGNRSTADVEKVLRRGFVAVKNFHDDAEAAFLSLS